MSELGTHFASRVRLHRRTFRPWIQQLKREHVIQEPDPRGGATRPEPDHQLELFARVVRRAYEVRRERACHLDPDYSLMLLALVESLRQHQSKAVPVQSLQLRGIEHTV